MADQPEAERARRSLKNVIERIRKPPYRTILLSLAVLSVAFLSYVVWQPGTVIRDGRHDLRTNGIWLQHGWLGDDLWFQKYNKDRSRFRSDQKVKALADLLRLHGVKYVFPHLCPCDEKGPIPLVDPKQTKRFLDHFTDFEVIPWSSDAKILLGVPAYDDSGKKYHFPDVENLRNAVLGIHTGLSAFDPLPKNYEGIAIYCEWEMNTDKWQCLKREFEAVSEVAGDRNKP